MMRKLRIEGVPHLVRPGMSPDARDRAVSQNFEHINAQLRLIGRALNLVLDDDSDFEEAEAPENIVVRFQRRKTKRRVRYNAIVRFDAPPDEHAAQSVVQLIYTDAAGNPVELDDDEQAVVHRKRVEVPDEDDTRDTLKAKFQNLEKPRYWYVSVRARWKTQKGWLGEWSAWTPPLLPKDNVTQSGSGQVSNLVHKHPAPGVHIWKWDEPEAEDVNVDRYKVVIERKDDSGYTVVETAYTRAQRFRYEVPKQDRGKRHRVTVYVVDEDGNESGAVAGPDEDDNATMDGTDITPGTLDITPFASNIRPVAIGSALPALPDANYPVGSHFYDTTTNRLYENQNEAWVDVASADNLSGQVGTAQIQANAITTDLLASGAVTAEKIAAGAIVAGKIAAGAVNTSELAAGAVTAEKIAADAITADKIAANAVTADKIDTYALISKYFSTSETATGSFIVIDGAGAKDQIQFWSGGGSTVMTATNQGVKIGGGIHARIGFYGATPIERPAVTGSRNQNEALRELLRALDNLGLIANNTTAT